MVLFKDTVKIRVPTRSPQRAIPFSSLHNDALLWRVTINTTRIDVGSFNWLFSRFPRGRRRRDEIRFTCVRQNFDGNSQRPVVRNGSRLGTKRNDDRRRRRARRLSFLRGSKRLTTAIWSTHTYARGEKEEESRREETRGYKLAVSKYKHRSIGNLSGAFKPVREPISLIIIIQLHVGTLSGPV